jgi:endonuclease-3
MAAKQDAKKHAAQVVKILQQTYPDAECALKFNNPLQLLIATILSAQCTDVRVNMVTPELFRRYTTAKAFAEAPVKDIEKIIQSTGFFRNKAKNIKACCEQLEKKFGGRVPQELDDLVNLPGVGRKTANVVLGTAFGIASGVVVDTHVGRISGRLGFTKHTNAVKAEQDLCKLLPQSTWIDYSHLVIAHGRAICTARKPLCDKCTLLKICPRIGVAKKEKTKL